MNEARRFAWSLLRPLVVLIAGGTVILASVMLYFGYEHEVLFDRQVEQARQAALALEIAALAMDVQTQVDEASEGGASGRLDEIGIYQIHRRLVNRFDGIERRLTRLCEAACPSLQDHLADFRAVAQMATEVGAVERTALAPYRETMHRKSLAFLHELAG